MRDVLSSVEQMGGVPKIRPLVPYLQGLCVPVGSQERPLARELLARLEASEEYVRTAD